MSVKSLLVVCDWCSAESEVEFKPEEGEAYVDSDNLLPDEDWCHFEQGGEEKDFCSRDCLQSYL